MPYEAERFEYRGYTVRIEQDEMAASPRDDRDNAGTLMFNGHPQLGDGIAEPMGHGRYMDYGEYEWSYECPRCEGEGQLDAWTDRARNCPKCAGEGFIRCNAVEWAQRTHDAGIAYALRFFDGGPCVTLDVVGDDSDRANGIAFLPRSVIRDEWGKGPAAHRKARAYLRVEIDEYAHYLRGDVWCADVLDADGETVDSLCGLIGDSDADWIGQEARWMVDALADADAREAQSAAYWAARDVETV
jgi:hypothetical protein